MRLISVTTKKELVAALAKRYAAEKREEKSRILDQLVSISGMHRNTRCVCCGGGGRATAVAKASADL